MKKTHVMDAMTKFIEYYTSNDQERIEIQKVLLDFMLEVYEHPVQEVYFRREGDKYMVKGERYPTFWIDAKDREEYIQQFIKLKVDVHVG